MGRFLIVFILASFISGEASANPAWAEMLRGSPAHGPHVRLVYLGAKTMSDQAAPVLSCHGTSCSPWEADGDTSENTGSGVKDLRAMHMCDCHVPTGTELKYESANNPYSPSTSVTVPASYINPSPGDLCQAECELADQQAAAKASDKSGGGCTFAPAPRQTVLVLLALLAGLIVVRRRRS